MATLITTNDAGRITRTDRTNDAAAMAIAERYADELGWLMIFDDGTTLKLIKGGELLTITLSASYVRNAH